MIHSGKLLKTFKDLKGKSSEELADSAGISLRTYLDIENGLRAMRVPELLAFSDFLDIEPIHLLDSEKASNSFNKIIKSPDSIICGDNSGNNSYNGIDKELFKELLLTLKEISAKLAG